MPHKPHRKDTKKLSSANYLGKSNLCIKCLFNYSNINLDFLPLYSLSLHI